MADINNYLTLPHNLQYSRDKLHLQTVSSHEQTVTDIKEVIDCINRILTEGKKQKNDPDRTSYDLSAFKKEIDRIRQSTDNTQLQNYYIAIPFEQLSTPEQILDAVNRLGELQKEDPKNKKDEHYQIETQLIFHIAKGLMNMWNAIPRDQPWRDELPEQAKEFRDMLEQIALRLPPPPPAGEDPSDPHAGENPVHSIPAF